MLIKEKISLMAVHIPLFVLCNKSSVFRISVFGENSSYYIRNGSIKSNQQWQFPCSIIIDLFIP